MDFREKLFLGMLPVSSWEELLVVAFCFCSFNQFKLPNLNGCRVMLQLAYQVASQKLLRSLMPLLPKKMGQ